MWWNKTSFSSTGGAGVCTQHRSPRHLLHWFLWVSTVWNVICYIYSLFICMFLFFRSIDLLLNKLWHCFLLETNCCIWMLDVVVFDIEKSTIYLFRHVTHSSHSETTLRCWSHFAPRCLLPAAFLQCPRQVSRYELTMALGSWQTAVFILLNERIRASVQAGKTKVPVQNNHCQSSGCGPEAEEPFSDAAAATAAAGRRLGRMCH